MLLALLFRWPVADYQTFQNNMVLTMGCLGFSFLLWRINPWVCALVIWVTLRGFAHITTYVYFLSGVVWYYFLVKRVRDTRPLLDMIGFIAIFNCLLIPFQMWTIHRYLGITGNENFLAAFLAISLPVFLRKNWRIWLFLIIPVLVLTKTFGGYLSATVGFLYYIFSIKWKYRWIAVLVLIECFVILMTRFDGPGLERLNVWFITAQYYFEQCFWLGAGLGTFANNEWLRSDLIQFTGCFWNHPHNEVLKAVYELGIIAIPLIYGVFWSYRKCKSVIPMTALVIILVNINVNFPLYIGATAILITTWLAILEIGGRNEKRSIRVR